MTDTTTTSIDNRPERAFLSPCFPCNPRPFAKRIGELVADNGTDAIRDDDCKACLWILMAQAYGQMARIDLCDEWRRLERVMADEEIAWQDAREQEAMGSNIHRI